MITSFVENIINPVIGLVGDQDFSRFVITLRDASAPGADDAIQLGYGAVITTIIHFVSVAAAIFFLIVKPLNVAGRAPQEGRGRRGGGARPRRRSCSARSATCSPQAAATPAKRTAKAAAKR